MPHIHTVFTHAFTHLLLLQVPEGIPIQGNYPQLVVRIYKTKVDKRNL